MSKRRPKKISRAKKTFVANLAWPEVESRIQQGAKAILAVGAAAKEHGKHLPLNTDLVQAEWLLDKLSKRSDILIWPPITYGYYPAFIDFPGSCSIAMETFKNYVVEIVTNIGRHGVKEIFIINTGISTIEPIEQAIASVPNSIQTMLINVYSGKHFSSAEKKVQQQARGGHADEIETSIMLAISPQNVHLKLANAWETPTVSGKLERFGRQNPNYAPDGVFGNPLLAKQSKGKKLLSAMLKDVEEAIDHYSKRRKRGRNETKEQ